MESLLERSKDADLDKLVRELAEKAAQDLILCVRVPVRLRAPLRHEAVYALEPSERELLRRNVRG